MVKEVVKWEVEGGITPADLKKYILVNIHKGCPQLWHIYAPKLQGKMLEAKGRPPRFELVFHTAGVNKLDELAIVGAIQSILKKAKLQGLIRRFK